MKNTRSKSHSRSSNKNNDITSSGHAPPTNKSVKRVVYLLMCLLIAFFLQNVISSNLKNTSIINSPMQIIAMNLLICLAVFGILLAIYKQPQQTYNANSNIRIKNRSMLENQKYKPCIESRLFCSTILCCCYCCFNASEDDIYSSNGKVTVNSRKTFLIPIAPWIHAVAIFLNIRY